MYDGFTDTLKYLSGPLSAGAAKKEKNLSNYPIPQNSYGFTKLWQGIWITSVFSK